VSTSFTLAGGLGWAELTEASGCEPLMFFGLLFLTGTGSKLEESRLMLDVTNGLTGWFMVPPLTSPFGSLLVLL
jgi:hypothetical protein